MGSWGAAGVLLVHPSLEVFKFTVDEIESVGPAVWPASLGCSAWGDVGSWGAAGIGLSTASLEEVFTSHPSDSNASLSPVLVVSTLQMI